MNKRALVLFLVLVMVGSAVVVATTVTATNEEKVPLKKPSDLTEEELKKLYERYNVSENDIKFAKGELPNFREGTILDGDKKVIVTEDGEIPKDLEERMEEKNISCDTVITIEKMLTIEEKARKDYMKEYGVDPINPKIDTVNGIFLPKEYVGKLVEEKIVKPEKPQKDDSLEKTNHRAMSVAGAIETFAIKQIRADGINDGPYAIEGELQAHIFPAADSNQNPGEEYAPQTDSALDTLAVKYNVDVYRTYYYGYWDTSDEADYRNSSVILGDLREDEDWVADERNDIVIGWVDTLEDHNGVAYSDGSTDGNFTPFALCACHCAVNPDWLHHDSLALHETSHLFNAPDHGITGPQCVMTDWDVYWGYMDWCSNCELTMSNNIDS